jgi:hypothetical protein
MSEKNPPYFVMLDNFYPVREDFVEKLKQESESNQ